MEVAGDGDSANISISANFVEKSDTIFWITADRIDKSGILVSLGLKILVIYLIVTFWTFVSFIQFAFFEFGLFREIYKNPLIVFELSFGVVAAVFLLLTVFSNQFRSVVRWLVFDLVEDVLALRFGPTRAMKARSARSRIGEMP